MTKLLAFLILVACTSAWPAAGRKGGDRKTELCQAALSNKNSNFATRGIPGLVSLVGEQPASSQELAAGLRLAEVLKPKRQTVVLIPTLQNLTVPALDGLIMNSSRIPIANLSIKTVAPETNLKNTIDKAIDQIVRYSVPSKWTEISNNLDWLSRAYGIFGIGEQRPTTLFIAITGLVQDRLSLEDVTLIQKRLNSKRYYLKQKLGNPIVSRVWIADESDVFGIQLVE